MLLLWLLLLKVLLLLLRLKVLLLRLLLLLLERLLLPLELLELLELEITRLAIVVAVVETKTVGGAADAEIHPLIQIHPIAA